MSKQETTDYRAYRSTFTKKAQQIVQKLSLEEKIYLMSGLRTMEEVRKSIQKKVNTHYNEVPYRAGGIDGKVPPVLFADGTKGVVCDRKMYTCFPVESMRGASFDPMLEKEIGEAIGAEVLLAGANLFGGVCVNLPYHPGWGRAQETFGEDPYLLGEMGAALVEGVQTTGVIACVKHFAFNSMENARFEVDITCDKKAEQEVFLSQFKRCVEAGAGAVMSSYNSYRGQMCGQNAYLLREVLKEDWQFDGFTLSDFNWGIKDTVTAANAGMDLEMPNTYYYGKKLLEAVHFGSVSEKVIDEAALRIVRTLLAHEEKIRQYGKIDAERQLWDDRQLAKKSALAGITLLRNRNGILPLSGRCHKIVVIGRLADEDVTGDRGSSQVYPPYQVTILQGILEQAGQEVIYYRGESLSHCKRLAKEADAVIVVAGNSAAEEGEYVYADMEELYVKSMGGDRTQGIALPAHDREILSAVAQIRQDAIVVLIGGSSFTMEDWIGQTGALLMAYYPGMEGGHALADVLFGKENPGGKLPFVIPQSGADLPQVDWSATQQEYPGLAGYRKLLAEGKQPLFPFGFGLSYTTFALTEEALECGQGEAEKAVICVTVQNTGKRAGSEVVQIYAAYEEEVQRLCRFEKVFLQAGEKRQLRMAVSADDLQGYDSLSGRMCFRPGMYRFFAGTDSCAKCLGNFNLG